MADSEIRILFISYNGIMEPLFHSQVGPYIKELAETGCGITLLTFEKRLFSRKEERLKYATFKDEFKRYGVRWHWLRYHKRPSLPATIYDILAGSIYSYYLIRRYKMDIIHARSTVPCAMAFLISRFTKVRFIFDIRGLMPEEYVEGGLWRKDSLTYKIARYFDRLFFLAADFRIVLSKRIKEIIENHGYINYSSNKDLKIEVIPSCVDLDRFTFSRKGRDYVREALGLDGKFVLLYIGSLGTWYMLDEMLDFFAYFRKKRKDAHFLIVTHNGYKQVEQGLARRNAGERDGVSVTSVAPSRMPYYISAGDAGIFFIKPTFSKISSSPTKLGEYLACGLPVVINAGIGDTADMVARDRVGVVLDDFSSQSYLEAATDILELAMDSSLNQHCRDAAREHLALEIAVDKYRKIYQYLNR